MTDLVIVDLDELTVSSSMIEVTDEVYHMIVDHRKWDAELQVHDNEPEVTAQDDGVIIRSRRSRSQHAFVNDTAQFGVDLCFHLTKTK